MTKTDNRRKLLKSILAGTSAVAVGNSLPDTWFKPVVNSVLLPAHAQTTGEQAEDEQEMNVFSQTLGFDLRGSGANVAVPDQPLVFPLNGVVPNGPGTVMISNLAGDLNSGAAERWTIQLGVTDIGETNNAGAPCVLKASFVINVSLADLQAAVSGGNITITAVNGGGIEEVCPGFGGTENNSMDVTLTFPSAPV